MVEGLALEALIGVPVPDTHSDVTETEPPDEEPAPHKVGRPRGKMSQRILALLAEHPEGLSAEQIRAILQPGRPLGDTLQGMRKAGVVTTQKAGKTLRYFAA